MSTLKCALMGFPQSDVEFFQTFFRLTAGFSISFTHTLQEADVDIFIVDVSDTAGVARVRHPAFNARALFVGDAAPDSPWPVVARPFSLMKLLQSLQELAMACPAGRMTSST